MHPHIRPNFPENCSKFGHFWLVREVQGLILIEPRASGSSKFDFSKFGGFEVRKIHPNTSKLYLADDVLFSMALRTLWSKWSKCLVKERLGFLLYFLKKC